MGLSKVTRNYQVTIPKDVRAVQDINIGDEVVFIIEENKVEIMKMKKNILEEAFGLWKGKIKGSSVDYVRKIREESELRRKRFGL